MNHTDACYQKFFELGHALDELMLHAKKTLPSDRFRVLESTSKKMITTFERAGTQLGYFIAQYERFNVPPRGPRGPATIHRLRPRKKR